MDPILLSVVLALGTYVLQFISKMVFDWLDAAHEKNRLRNEHALKRIEFQLGEVFGPMRGRLLSSKSAFTALALRASGGAGGDVAVLPPKDCVASLFVQVQAPVPAGGDPNAVQREWMLWVEHVLQPSNRELCSIILEKSHGFDRMPGFLPNVLAHCKEFEVILKKWEQHDYTHMLPSLQFDDRINGFVEAEFKRLKQRQATILKAMDVEHHLGSEVQHDDDRGIELLGDDRVDSDPQSKTKVGP